MSPSPRWSRREPCGRRGVEVGKVSKGLAFSATTAACPPNFVCDSPSGWWHNGRRERRGAHRRCQLASVVRPVPSSLPPLCDKPALIGHGRPCRSTASSAVGHGFQPSGMQVGHPPERSCSRRIASRSQKGSRDSELQGEAGQGRYRRKYSPGRAGIGTRCDPMRPTKTLGTRCWVIGRSATSGVSRAGGRHLWIRFAPVSSRGCACVVGLSRVGFPTAVSIGTLTTDRVPSTDVGYHVGSKQAAAFCRVDQDSRVQTGRDFVSSRRWVHATTAAQSTRYHSIGCGFFLPVARKFVQTVGDPLECARRKREKDEPKVDHRWRAACSIEPSIVEAPSLSASCCSVTLPYKPLRLQGRVGFNPLEVFEAGVQTPSHRRVEDQWLNVWPEPQAPPSKRYRAVPREIRRMDGHAIVRPFRVSGTVACMIALRAISNPSLRLGRMTIRS